MIYTGEEAQVIVGTILDNYDEESQKYPCHEGDAGYFKDGKVWCAWDNTTGDCWCEDFKTRREAKAWVEEV